MKNKSKIILAIIIVILIIIFYSLSKTSTKNVEVDDSFNTNTVTDIKARPTIISSSCNITETRKLDKETYKLVSLKSNGTATGPVGTKFTGDKSELGINNVWEHYLNFDCGSWSKKVDEYNSFVTCIREENQPEKTSWSMNFSDYLYMGRDARIRITAAVNGSSPDYPEGIVDQIVACN